MIAALFFTALCVLLVALQIAVAAGAPLGPYVWGGQHDGPLPRQLRISSVFSVLIYAAMVLIVWDRAEILDIFPDGFTKIAVWVVFGFLTFGTLLNLISRSKKERAVMTPLAGLLALSALLVALGL